MQMMTLKEQLHRLVDTLPDAKPNEEAIEELQYRIYVLDKVQRGLSDLDAGRVLTHDQARKELSKWLDE